MLVKLKNGVTCDLPEFQVEHIVETGFGEYIGIDFKTPKVKTPKVKTNNK